MTLAPGDNTTSLSTTGYNYDPSTQRLANISLPGGSYSANYLYFTNSNTASDQINTVEVQPTSGNPITITYLRDPSDLSRLEKVTYSGSQGTAFTDSLVDPSGNGRFNPIDQITGRDMTRTVLATNSGGTIVSQSEDDKYNYGYDPNHGDALTAVYDGNNNNAVLDSYNYDNAGNRTDLGTVNSVNDYGNYTYNARHDQTSEGNLNYGFDAKDRLISETPKVPAEGSIEETMGYDSGNHLMWLDFYQYHLGKWGTGPVESEHFVWDGDQMAAMLDGSNDLLQAYTYGPTGLIAISDYTQSLGNPSTYVVVSDLSGNVQGLLNPDGTVAASYHYGPFGENFNAVLSPALRGVDPNPFGFAGGYTDELSGLVYFHNRWYSPSQGRFITEDPLGVAGGENADTYARNDPVNNDDPSGLLTSHIVQWINNLGRKYVDPVLTRAVGRVAGPDAAQTFAESAAWLRGFGDEFSYQTDITRRLANGLEHPVQTYNGGLAVIDSRIAAANAALADGHNLALGELTGINRLAEGIYNAHVLGPPRPVGNSWTRFNYIGNGTASTLNTATVVVAVPESVYGFGNGVLTGVREANAMAALERSGLAFGKGCFVTGTPVLLAAGEP